MWKGVTERGETSASELPPAVGGMASCALDSATVRQRAARPETKADGCRGEVRHGGCYRVDLCQASSEWVWVSICGPRPAAQPAAGVAAQLV